MSRASIDCKDIPLRGWSFQPGQDHLPSDSANSDIAGVGIAIGFSAAAYLTFIFVVFYYIFGYVEAPFSNTLDHACIKFLWKWAIRPPSKTWEPFLRKAILIYSDTQLVTGLAILGSLYPQLVHNLPSYYWQIAVYLAWFSSHTHLTSITILRQFLRDHPMIRFWRVLLMLIMATMLVIALLPTGDSYWMVDNKGHFLGGVPAMCHFRRLREAHDFTPSNNQGFTMMISFLVIFFGYTTRIFKLSARSTAFLRKWFRIKPGKMLRGLLDRVYIRILKPNSSVCWRIPYILLETYLVLGKAGLDAWESMLWEILWLFMALLWGSLHLFLARTQNLWKIRWQTAVYEKIPQHQDDNDWSFAQVFEVILLFLPILHTGEAFFEHRREIKLGLHSRQIVYDPELDMQYSSNPSPQDVECTPSASTQQEKQASTIPATPVTPSLPASTPTPPLLPNASHEQNYHERPSYRLLVALILLFSLGVILFAVGLSLLYDVNWAYWGVLACLAFCVAETILWASVMVIWMHCRDSVVRLLGIESDQAKRKMYLAEMIFAVLVFCAKLAGSGIFMYALF